MADDFGIEAPTQFFRLNNPFCEGIYLGYPDVFGKNSTFELGGSLSNLGYLVLGLFAFYSCRRADPLIKLQCTLLALTGVGSTLYHATFYYGMGLVDGIPMLLMICLMLLGILDDVILSVLKIRPEYRYACSVTMFLSTMGYMLFGLQQNSLDDSVLSFSTLFALPIAILIVMLGYIFIVDQRKTEVGKTVKWLFSCGGCRRVPTPSLFRTNSASNLLERQSRRSAKGVLPGSEQDRVELLIIVIRGLSMMGIAFGFHLFDDHLCGPRSVYAFGHVWWHLLSGYAGYCVICFNAYVRAGFFMQKPHLIWYPVSWYPRFRVLPSVEWHLDPDLAMIIGKIRHEKHTSQARSSVTVDHDRERMEGTHEHSSAERSSSGAMRRKQKRAEATLQQTRELVLALLEEREQLVGQPLAAFLTPPNAAGSISLSAVSQHADIRRPSLYGGAPPTALMHSSPKLGPMLPPFHANPAAMRQFPRAALRSTAPASPGSPRSHHELSHMKAQQREAAAAGHEASASHPTAARRSSTINKSQLMPPQTPTQNARRSPVSTRRVSFSLAPSVNAAHTGHSHSNSHSLNHAHTPHSPMLTSTRPVVITPGHHPRPVFKSFSLNHAPEGAASSSPLDSPTTARRPSSRPAFSGVSSNQLAVPTSNVNNIGSPNHDSNMPPVSRPRAMSDVHTRHMVPHHDPHSAIMMTPLRTASSMSAPDYYIPMQLSAPSVPGSPQFAPVMTPENALYRNQRPLFAERNQQQAAEMMPEAQAPYYYPAPVQGPYPPAHLAPFPQLSSRVNVPPALSIFNHLKATPRYSTNLPPLNMVARPYSPGSAGSVDSPSSAPGRNDSPVSLSQTPSPPPAPAAAAEVAVTIDPEPSARNELGNLPIY